MDETDHGLTPRIADLKVNRKVNEINDLPGVDLFSLSKVTVGDRALA